MPEVLTLEEWMFELASAFGVAGDVTHLLEEEA